MSEREDRDRQAFEVVFIGNLPLQRLKNSQYIDHNTHFAWLGFQAALRYERERTKESGNAE